MTSHWFESNVLQPQVLLICAAALLISTGFAAVRKWHLLSARLFGAMGLLMAILCVIRAIVWSDLVDAQAATVLYRAYYVVVCAGSCVMFHFCLHELSLRKHYWFHLLANWQAGLWIALTVIGSNVMIEGVVETAWGFEPLTKVAGALVLLWIFMQLSFVFVNCLLIMRQRMPGSLDWRRLRGLKWLMLSLVTTMIEPMYHAFGLAYPVMPIVMTGSVLGGVYYVLRFGLNKLPAEQLALQIFELLPHAAIHCDVDGYVVNVNHKARQLLGQSVSEIRGRSLSDALNPQLSKELLSDLAELQEGDTDFPLAAADTPVGRDLLLSVDANIGANGLPSSWMLTLKTQEKKPAQNGSSGIDPVTGLSSRSSFTRLLQAGIVRTQFGDESASILMMGVSGFSAINAKYGYDVGDQLLTDIGARFREALALRGAASRTGGDEFACMLIHKSDYPQVSRVQSDLEREMGREFQLSNGDAIRVNFYFGSACSAIQMGEAPELLRAAQLDLHRNDPAKYERDAAKGEQVGPAIKVKQALADELAGALSRQEFRPHYQAVLDLDRRSVVGFHTLLRWYHPDGSVRVAADFIKALVQADMMKEVEQQLHEQMLADAPQLIAAAGESTQLQLYFKLDRSSLSGQQWERRFGRFACDNPELTRHLALEVSESESLLANVKEALCFFADLGYGVSLDQFGSSYSALSQLAEMPLTDLCIDHHFVRGTMLHARSRLLVEGIAQMAEDLGLRLIAKGVSVPAEARQLVQHGCSLQQGKLYSPPLELTQAVAVLQEQDELLYHWIQLPETRLYQGQKELA